MISSTKTLLLSIPEQRDVGMEADEADVGGVKSKHAAWQSGEDVLGRTSPFQGS